MITKQFNKELGILETKFTGIVEIKDVINYILSLAKDNSLPDTLKIFTDASNAKFAEGVSQTDIEDIVKANFLTLKKRFFIYDAFIISGSLEMALGQLYQEFSKNENYKFGIFSSKIVAMEWLDTF